MRDPMRHLLAAARSTLCALLVSQIACLGVSRDQITPAAESTPKPAVASTRGELNPPALPTFSVPTGPREPVAYQARTTDDGAAEVVIPVWTPPGRKGIEPNLALVYNSRAGHGLLGLGGSISGLSQQITRCWKTLAQDGVHSTTAIPDEFCLDGQRLIRSPSNDRDYRLEGDGSSKITAVDGTPTDPAHFELRTRGAQIRRFGAREAISHSLVAIETPLISAGPNDLPSVSPGPRRTMGWKLDTVQDLWGNALHVNYLRSSSGLGRVEVVPSEILYTSSSFSAGATRRVRLSYRPALQPSLSTTALVTVESRNVVDKITVEAQLRSSEDPYPGPLTVYREYRMTYLAQATGKRREDRLSSVTECYGPGTLTCSESLVFGWNDPGDEVPTFATPSVIGRVVSANNPSTLAAAEVIDSAVGDFNGDGFDDYLLRRPVVLATANEASAVIQSGTVWFLAEWLIAKGSTSGLGALTPIAGLPGSSSSSPEFSPRVIDLDRDGRDEVVLVTSTPGIPTPNQDQQGGLTTVSFKAYDVFGFDSAANNFVPRSAGEIYSHPYLAGFPIRSFPMLLGDVTGDGFADIVRPPGTTCTATGAGTSQCEVTSDQLRVRAAISPGTSFGPPTALLGSSSATPNGGNVGGPTAPAVVTMGGEQFILDVDGNGSAEILSREFVVTETGSGFSSTLRMFRNGAVPGELHLHAEPLQTSAMAASAIGAGCFITSSRRNGLVRYFLDVDGDNQTDSYALPSVNRDDCGTVRNWQGASFLSRNVGGRFLPPAFEQVGSLPHIIGPSVLEQSNSGVPTSSGGGVPTDWTGLHRNVDNGVRIADVNRDGRSDLLLLGDNVDTIVGLQGCPSHRTVPWVRFGLPTGEFSVPRPLSSVSANNCGFWPAIPSANIVGRGPRDRRLGDFNGDGLFDLARIQLSGGQALTFELVQHLQDQTPADAVGSISSPGVNSHTPRTTFEYAFAGPREPNFYSSPTMCSEGQRCIKKAGWLVRRHSTESGDFSRANPAMSVVEHTYSDARSDFNGRGWLGFSSHRILNPSLQTLAQRAVSHTRFPLATAPSLRYTYRKGVEVSSTAPTQAGTWSKQATLEPPTLVTDPQTAFRVESTTTREATFEPVELSRTTTVSSFDVYGNMVRTESTVSTLASPLNLEKRITTLLGPNAVDTNIWLVNRYQSLKEESEVGGVTEERKTAFSYVSGKPELASRTVQPDAPVEQADTSGLRSEETYGYDQYGNVASVTSRGDSRSAINYRDRVTQITFDTRDSIFPISTTNPENHLVKSYFETGSGLLIGIDDENSQRTLFTYNQTHKPTEVQLPSGENITFTYTSPAPTSRVRSTILRSDANGLSYEDRDPLGRLLRRGRPAFSLGSVREDYVYDLHSRVTAVSLPYQSSATPLFVERDYDSLGRVTHERRPTETPLSAKAESRWEYAGLKTTSFSERNVKHERILDFMGREVEDVSWDGARAIRVRREYGPFGHLKKVIHPTLNRPMSPAPAQLTPETILKTDVLGRVLEVIDPDSGTETRRYTPFGELKRSTDANGGVTVRAYDRLGRMTSIETAATPTYPVPAGSTLNFAQQAVFDWDLAANGKGLLQLACSVADGVCTHFEYNSKSQLSNKVVNIIGEDMFSFGYRYDSKGRLEHESMPPTTAAPVGFDRAYSPSGELESIHDATNTNSRELLWRLIRKNAAGQVADEQFGQNSAGSVVSRIFDASFHLRIQKSTNAITGTPLQHLTYQWGPDELIERKSDLLVGLEEKYGHDSLRRLTSWDVRQNCRVSKWAYAYDDWSNLRERTLDEGLSCSAQFPCPSGQTCSQGRCTSPYSVTNRYTASGVSGPIHAAKQVVENGATENYQYLPGGQVTVGGANSYVWRPLGLPDSVTNTNGTTSAYKYDAFGQRVFERTTSAGQVRKVITIDGRYEKRIEPSGGAVHGYTITTDSVVGQLLRATNSGGTLLSRQVQFFHSDHLGSPDTISASGQVVDRVKYEPFGERRHHWAVAHPIRASHQSNASYGFTGHQPDDGLGQVNMRGRVYSPRTTQFASADPIAFTSPQGLNRFSYVQNSPIQLVDPSGFLSVPSTLPGISLGQSASEVDKPEVSRYETIVRGDRVKAPTSDSTSNVIYAPGSDGVVDQTDVLARGLIDLESGRAILSTGGTREDYEASIRAAGPVIAAIKPADWQRVVDRMSALRGFSALERFVRMRRAIEDQANSTLFGAGRTEVMSTAKLWSNLALLLAATSLGVVLAGNASKVPALTSTGRVVYPRGPGASSGPVPSGHVPVSRWVSEAEANAWIGNGGTHIPSGIGGESGRVYVTAPGVARPGGTGPVRIDFTVDAASLNPAGKEGWFQVMQPAQNMPIHNVTVNYPAGL